VQLVCSQRADSNGNCGSVSDRNQQQQQHADRHVGSCHLQREVHWIVEDSSIQLNSKLNNTLINELRLLFLVRDAVKFGRSSVETFCLHFHFSLPTVDVIMLSPGSVKVCMCVRCYTPTELSTTVNGRKATNVTAVLMYRI
jgi:hypothetical protein